MEGLFVILTERLDAARIDRLLAGRCGRRGDPGFYGAILSLEDPILASRKNSLSFNTALFLCRLLVWLPSVCNWIGSRMILYAQQRIEREHARIRRDLIKYDEHTADKLYFSGRAE